MMDNNSWRMILIRTLRTRASKVKGAAFVRKFCSLGFLGGWVFPHSII
jgi:hypothetical protein